MSERGNNGRFKKGNPGGPGRPPRMVEMDYLSALSEQVPREEFAAIVRDAVARARNGDAKAREWLSRYLLPSEKGNHLLQLAAREAISGGVDDVIKEAINAVIGQEAPLALGHDGAARGDSD